MSEEKKVVKRQRCEIYSRISGYMRPVSSWNDAKREEFSERTMYKTNKEVYEENNKK